MNKCRGCGKILSEGNPITKPIYCSEECLKKDNNLEIESNMNQTPMLSRDNGKRGRALLDVNPLVQAYATR